VRASVDRNPNTAIEVFKELAHDSDWFVLQDLKENQNTPSLGWSLSKEQSISLKASLKIPKDGSCVMQEPSFSDQINFLELLLTKLHCSGLQLLTLQI